MTRAAGGEETWSGSRAAEKTPGGPGPVPEVGGVVPRGSHQAAVCLLPFSCPPNEMAVLRHSLLP